MIELTIIVIGFIVAASVFLCGWLMDHLFGKLTSIYYGK